MDEKEFSEMVKAIRMAEAAIGKDLGKKVNRDLEKGNRFLLEFLQK